MSVAVADTSVWIEFFAGRKVPTLEDALRHGLVVLPPIVVAELISGARRPRDRVAIADLVTSLPLHATPVEHWIRVGELRQRLLQQGISVSTPDAHVAQCALDLEAVLLTRDTVFRRIAESSPLRVVAG